MIPLRNIKTFLANLTHHAGVYQMLGEKGEIIYVGKAKDLKKRVSSYFSRQAKDPKTLSLVKHIHDIDITVTRNENEAVILECNLIKKHSPRYNVLLRDDKSYPYIIITDQHPFPRIDIYRGPRKKNAKYFGPFPSSLAVRETIQLLQKLFRLRTCRDSYFDARSRPCLLYQIGRCTGPCVKLISHEDYAQNVKLAMLFLEGKSSAVIEVLQKRMEEASVELDYELAADYRDQITRLRQIQDKQYVHLAAGNADVMGLATAAGISCIQLLTIREGQVLTSHAYFPSTPAHSPSEEIIEAFLTQHYLTQPSPIESLPKEIITEMTLPDRTVLQNVLGEQAGRRVDILAPKRGEKKKWLKMALSSARQSLSTHLLNQANMHERAAALRDALSLKNIPARIECFDISHSMGEAATASCVVFDRHGPVKSEYRRFNISGITAGDDVAAMHQAIRRRFRRLKQEDAVLPDVLLIDGGETQLKAAHDVITELEIKSIFLLAVSKGPGRKPGFESLHFVGQAPRHLPSDSLALHFIQQIRDEAHRFAITGHRHRRDKTRRHSTLEYIPGIGAKRRRELLRYFGGIQGVAHASLDELIKVPGISRSLAERIFAALHDTTL